MKAGGAGDPGPGPDAPASGAGTAGVPGAARLMDLVAGLPDDLLGRALTHSSWVERRSDSYERLEFLGDSVLGLSVAAHLFERFPGVYEGDLARWKAFVVSRESCHVVACRLGVDRLVLGSAPGDEAQRQELAASGTALGNILEALIGACYLAYGFGVVAEAVTGAFYDQVTYAEREYVDYKSTLQEVLAAEGKIAEYELEEEEGPPHERMFSSKVSSAGDLLGRGRGRSIKKSEQRAARRALGLLGVLPEDEVPDEPDDGGGRATCGRGGEES